MNNSRNYNQILKTNYPSYLTVNTVGLEQVGQTSADNIFKWISRTISRKFALKGHVDNMSAKFQVII